VSGWQRDGAIGLTATKFAYWHTGRCSCGLTEPVDLYERHLRPRGWEWLSGDRTTNFLVIRHPEYREEVGTPVFAQGYLYECLCVAPGGGWEPRLQPSEAAEAQGRYVTRDGRLVVERPSR
jgi:hypothetical protein